MAAEIEKIILYDCDTGSDDAIALMMLLSHWRKVKTVAVTCIDGNAHLDNVIMNNLRILKLYDQLDKVPVFKGCQGPLMNVGTATHCADVHGDDGLGNVPDIEPAASPDLLKHLQEEHAVNAIIRLSKEYIGKLTIVATGPLTNIAMAVKLDPDLPKRLKALYIMGGNRYGKGNVTPAAEFNFLFDPEAAHITLNAYASGCETHIIDYELTLTYSTPWPLYDKWLSDENNKKTKFAKMILTTLRDFCLKDKDVEFHAGMALCDAYAMAIALNKDVAVKSTRLGADVEVAGFHSRGSLVVNHFSKNFKMPSVIFYDEINIELYHQLLAEAFL